MDETPTEPDKTPSMLPPEPTPVEKIRKWYMRLPDKKRYLEFLTALLTIPVLLTVLISNVSNLQNQKKQAETPTPTIQTTPQPTIPAGTPTPSPAVSATPTPSPGPECIREVGPISITYPTEGQTVTGDPVCLTISRPGQNYCSVVWSYNINGGTWSDFTGNDICMYGLTPGVKNLKLRVQSVVSSQAVTLSRTFTVAGPTPTPSPTTATQSAALGN